MADELENIEAFARTLATRFLRPQFPQLLAALEVVTGIDRETLERAMQGVRWQWHCDKNRNGIEYTLRKPNGSFDPHWVKSPRDRVVDPVEAMELLAGRGIIPDNWIGSMDRRFAAGARGVAPPSLRGVVAIASNVSAVLECERLAKELFARLAPFGATKSPRIVWRVDGTAISGGSGISAVNVGEGGVPGGALMESAIEAAELRNWVVRTRMGGVEKFRPNTAVTEFEKLAQNFGSYDQRYVSNSIRAYQSWVARSSAGAVALVVEDSPIADERMVRSIPVSELLNPFEPLLLIFARGFALAEVSRKSVHLLALSNFDAQHTAKETDWSWRTLRR